MEFKDLSPDQREKVEACKNPEEILALAKEEGYELSESELDQVAGGGWSSYETTCPECKKVILVSSSGSQEITCPSCGYSYCLITSK